MNRIRLLPEQVANQIAAGEVVERPASVVKELVENALDAQARRIVVEIQAGGRSLIRVTDDGIGMSRDDALLSLERHATSKIQRAQDLCSISTMGFRGEALPSIASVSRMSITTREHDAPEGTQIILHGGKIIEVKAAGSAPGTSVEVRQLFFNLPARRKFLRSEETERTHIQHYLTLAALSHPEVSFVFVQDNRTLWQLPGIRIDPNSRHAPLQERLRALYGGEQRFVPLLLSTRLTPSRTQAADAVARDEAGLLEVWGFIGAPGVSRATRDAQHLFVNRRPVENRGLNFALLEGYHTSLMKGRYPVCCLFLEIDPGEVDVNIHPAKREVKFHREQEVRSAVTRAVRETLMQFHGQSSPPPVSFFLPQRPLHAAPQAPRVSSDRPSSSPSPASAEPGPSRPLPSSGLAPHPEQSREAAHPAEPSLPGPSAQTVEQDAGAQTAAPASNAEGALFVSADSGSSADREQLQTAPLLQVPLRLVGVVGRLYVVLESDRGLVLLDQHAAHERILFEQMLRRLEQGDAPSQRLLLPETIELSHKDAQFLREQLPVLSRLGVGLSEFGDRTFLLDAVPPFVDPGQSRRFVLQTIDELKASGPEPNPWRLGEQTIAKTVCRHAVKANDPLEGAELEKLVEDLRRCTMPYTCPHGRPTLIEMNYRELERKFGRTVSG